MDALLKQAYKKLKSHLYTDKTLLKEKIELGRFETNLSENLEALLEAINSKNISKWIKEISFTLVPKKIKDEMQASRYSNKTKQDKYNVESYNIFISAPIEIHLISTLWTMVIGKDLDSQLIENVKGNRLHRDKNQEFKNDSYKLFRPYYEGYQSFRDEAIDMATTLHGKKLDVTVLNIDIQEFYYNIGFDFSDLKEVTDVHSLNQLMQEIHSAFHAKVKTLKPKLKTQYKQDNFLPIGLVSSSVIANYVLVKLDKDIVENLKPEYYSRYVDDMLFVFSNANMDITTEAIVSDLFSNKLKDTSIKNEKIEIIILTNNLAFKLQNEKVKLFQFYKDDSISLLEKFKQKIDENSSFFNFMPDDEKLFKTLESSSYSIFYNNSENKLSSLIGTAKDTLKISRNLTGVLATISSAKFDEAHLKIYNEQIQHVFSGHNIFELRLHWEKIFTYLYISGNDNLFVQMLEDFYEAINQIENIKKSKLVQDTHAYLLYSILFAVSSNPKHFTEVLIQKIKDVNIEFEQMINTTDIELVRASNMFSNHLMTYPLLNYTATDDEGPFVNMDTIDSVNYLTKKIQTENLKFVVNDAKFENSPRFIHYHEVILFNHYLFLNSQLEGQKEFYNTDEGEVFQKYNHFNNFAHAENNSFPAKDKEEKNLYIINRNNDENKEKLKIGIVSIKISLKDIESTYVTAPNLSYERLQGIFDILNKSIEKKNKVDLLVFPEVSIPYAWVHLMARFAKKNDIGIIFGVEHIKIKVSDEKTLISNYTCIMLPFTTDGHTNLFINFEAKKHFAPDEKIGIESRGFIANENIDKKPTLYKWRNSVFSTFNCYELTNILYRSSLVGKVDFVVAIEYNKDTNHFSNIIDSLSRDLHCYVVQVNTSDYGDSRIVQPSKTESKDLVKLKGGENIYLVVDSIDVKKLRDFQAKGHCLQKNDENFKLTPPDFKILRNRTI